MKIITSCCYIILFSLLSCSSKSQQDSLQFNVDENLLNDKYIVDSLNFVFAPPLGWQKDPSKIITSQTHQFQNEELSSYLLTIKEIFYDSLSSSFCSISVIHSNDSIDSNHFTTHFNSLLIQQFSETNLKKGQFTKDQMEITQFLINTDKSVFFKLFFQPTTKYIIQLDYAIDRLIYPNYIKKIESSIGSITTI